MCWQYLNPCSVLFWSCQHVKHIADSRCHHSVIECPHQRPQSSQQLESSQALLVQDICVVRPVQFVVEVNPQVFVIPLNLNVQSLDDVRWSHFLAEVSHHLLCVASVDVDVVLSTPVNKVGDDVSILHL